MSTYSAIQSDSEKDNPYVSAISQVGGYIPIVGTFIKIATTLGGAFYNAFSGSKWPGSMREQLEAWFDANATNLSKYYGITAAWTKPVCINWVYEQFKKSQDWWGNLAYGIEYEPLTTENVLKYVETWSKANGLAYRGNVMIWVEKNGDALSSEYGISTDTLRQQFAYYINACVNSTTFAKLTADDLGRFAEYFSTTLNLKKKLLCQALPAPLQRLRLPSPPCGIGSPRP